MTKALTLTLAIALAAPLALATGQAHALTWICSTSTHTRVAIAAAELPEGATASGAAVGLLTRSPRHRTRIDRLDLIQAYSGQPVLLGGTWLLAVMLPASHPDTRAAFADLGLHPEAAERMASGTGLIDRGIRIVQTPDQMIHKVGINPPAVGYVGFFAGARDAASCF